LTGPPAFATALPWQAAPCLRLGVLKIDFGQLSVFSDQTSARKDASGWRLSMFATAARNERSPQRLHEALHCAKAQLQIEVAVNRDSIFELPAAIICYQLCAFRFCKIDIRIVEQRREIVMGKTGSHSLKINQMSLPVLDDNVLRLKITVHQNSWQTRKVFCYFAQSRKRGQLFAF
jgi:hypothetical protein